MINLPEGISMKDVEGFPGWKLVSDGKNRRFLSPGGKNISRARFDKLRNRAKREQRDIRESEIKASLDDPLPGIDNLFQPIKVSRPEDHPDASAQAMSNQPPPVEEEPSRAAEIIDNLPEPELGNRKSKKKPVTATEFADKMSNMLIIGTDAIAGAPINVPELRMRPDQARKISAGTAYFFEKYDLLDSGIAKVVANSESATVALGAGKALYDYLYVAIPAVKARIDNIKADTEWKRAQTNQMNQQQQQQGLTWEQQQQQRQEQVNNSVKPVSQNGDGRPIFGRNTFSNLDRPANQPKPFIPPQGNQ